MYHLQSQVTGKYVKALIKLKDGRYAIYYTDEIKEAMERWVTLRGAEAALNRLYKSGTLEKPGVLAVVAEVN